MGPKFYACVAMSYDKKCLCRMIRISKLCLSHVKSGVSPLRLDFTAMSIVLILVTLHVRPSPCPPGHDRPSPTCTPSHETRPWPPTLKGRADNLAQHCQSIGRPFPGLSHTVDKSAGS